MKKRTILLCLGLATAMLFSLAGCSGGNQSSGSHMTTDKLVEELENSGLLEEYLLEGEEEGDYYDEDGDWAEEGEDGTTTEWSEWRNVVPAPDFAGTDIAGNKVRFAHPPEAKSESEDSPQINATLVSFLSTKAASAKDACEAIQQLYDKHGDTYDIIVVSALDDETACKAFYKGYTFPVLPDPMGIIGQDYNALPDPYDDEGTVDENPEPFTVDELPESFVIDGDGDVYQIVTGAVDYEQVSAFLYDVAP